MFASKCVVVPFSVSLTLAVGCSAGSKRLELTGHDGEVSKVAIRRQSTTISGRSPRSDAPWMTLAASSLPVPASPRSKTGHRSVARPSSLFLTLRIGADTATM